MDVYVYVYVCVYVYICVYVFVYTYLYIYVLNLHKMAKYSYKSNDMLMLCMLSMCDYNKVLYLI